MGRNPLNLDQNPVVIDPDDIEGALKDEPTVPAAAEDDEEEEHPEVPRPPEIQDPGH